MNIFIIGGTGFLGYHSALELLRCGHAVTALGLPPLPQDKTFTQNVRLIVKAIEEISNEELYELMCGHDALVFAASVDDRIVPPEPAYPYFQHGNVEVTRRIVTLAKQAGLKRAVILGSYFAHFNRIWPQLKLAQHHPYIRSRVEQEDVCFSLTAPGFDVIVLELPYIFGSMPGRKPLWTPLIKYIHFINPLFYMHGGSACVSVQTVAAAIAGALKSDCGSNVYQIGDENMTWVEMLTHLGTAIGKHVKVITLPTWLLSLTSWTIWLYRKLHKQEGGLDMRYFAPLQTTNMFIDPAPAQSALGFYVAPLNQAFLDTVSAAT